MLLLALTSLFYWIVFLIANAFYTLSFLLRVKCALRALIARILWKIGLLSRANSTLLFLNIINFILRAWSASFIYSIEVKRKITFNTLNTVPKFIIWTFTQLVLFVINLILFTFHTLSYCFIKIGFLKTFYTCFSIIIRSLRRTLLTF